MPRSSRPVAASPTLLLPVRIHAAAGLVFLSVGAAHRDVTPAGARHVARCLDTAADRAEDESGRPDFHATAAARGHRTPHARPVPGGLVELRFDTASLLLTEADALKLSDALTDAAEATRDVLAPGADQ